MITPIERSQFSHWRVYLRYLITTYFNDNDLRVLCFDLGIDYDSLAGANKEGKVIELIQLMIKIGQVITLIDYCSLRRPNLNWSQIRQEVSIEMTYEKPQKSSILQTLKKWATISLIISLVIITMIVSVLYLLKDSENTQVTYPTNTIAEQPQSIISTSTPDIAPKILNFSACTTACNGSNSTTLFPAGTNRIYAQWDYANIPYGARYERAWSMDGSEWVKYVCDWPGPQDGTEVIDPLWESHGLHSGTWTVTISVNGQELLRESFIVQGNNNYWVPAGTRPCED